MEKYMEIILSEINSKIYTIRDVQVMLDRDLADLYGVENRRLNEQVKRNIERFPNEFMFQLTKEELANWKSQFATSNSEKMGLRKLPYVFTEQGVSMLSSILRSDTAIKTSIMIIKSFISMRSFLSTNANIFQRLDSIELKQLQYQQQTNSKFDEVFRAIESKQVKPSQGIFYDGEVFDAYTFIVDLVRNAQKEIVLIDNYIDDTTLTIFSKIPNIKVTIYTHTISKQLKLDFQKYNTQYNNITIKTFKNSHDRFMIIDNKDIYHIGASLKDLGKKWFAFSRIQMESVGILEKLRDI
jgi:hypothetical protein